MISDKKRSELEHNDFVYNLTIALTSTKWHCCCPYSAPHASLCCHQNLYDGVVEHTEELLWGKTHLTKNGFRGKSV